MPNLLVLEGADGRIIGRCNQHCYNAVNPHRACICGGINNGVGKAQAVRNVPRVLHHICSRPDTAEPVTLHIRLHPDDQADIVEDTKVCTTRRDRLLAGLRGHPSVVLKHHPKHP